MSMELCPFVSALGGVGGDVITNSLRFNDGDSPSLSRTATYSAGSTYFFAIKRGEVSSANPLVGTTIQFNADDTLTAFGLTTTQKFRDTAGWYLIHVSDNGLVVNGDNLGAVTTSSLASPVFFNSFDGLVARVVVVDGSTVAYTDFMTQSDDGRWLFKEYAGAYGTEGFKLDFTDNTTAAALGTDVSGNGNNFTPSGITTDDQRTDTPTNNCATWNPNNDRLTPTYSEANGTVSSASADTRTSSTIAMFTGKWLIPIRIDAKGGTAETMFGLTSSDIYSTTPSEYYLCRTSDGAITNTQISTSLSWTAHGSSIAVSDWALIAYDADAGNVWFGKYSGSTITWFSGDPELGTSPGYAGISAGMFVFWGIQNSATNTATIDCALDEFPGTLPTGFNNLSSANLPTATISTTNLEVHLDPQSYISGVTVPDDSGNGLDFQRGDGVTASTYPTYTDNGQPYWLFDGGDYIDQAAAYSGQLPRLIGRNDQAFTLIIFGYMASTGYLAANANATTDKGFALYASAGNIRCDIYPINQNITGGAIPLNEFAHFAVTCKPDGTTLSRLYLNGVQSGSATIGNNTGFATGDSTNQMHIGSSGTAASLLASGSRVATVRAYSRILTAEEIYNDYRAEKGRYQTIGLKGAV